MKTKNLFLVVAVILFRTYDLVMLVLLLCLYLRYGSDDPPVLPGQTWGSHCHLGLLGAALSVHICATFLSVCSARKDDISHWCTKITMMT